jgi:membrane dipeptidase
MIPSAAIVPHVRNVTDKVLVKLKSNRGLLMVSLIPTLTATDPSTATVTNIVDHMQHTASLIGYEHVGIGSDFDGMSHTVIGLEDVSKYPALVVEMLKRGIREHDIRSVLGENIIRVFRRVEEESTRLQNIPVTEDVIEPMWPPELMDWCRAQWPMAKH